MRSKTLCDKHILYESTVHRNNDHDDDDHHHRCETVYDLEPVSLQCEFFWSFRRRLGSVVPLSRREPILLADSRPFV